VGRTFATEDSSFAILPNGRWELSDFPSVFSLMALIRSLVSVPESHPFHSGARCIHIYTSTVTTRHLQSLLSSRAPKRLHRMPEELKFTRSDGDSSLWPVCEQFKDEKRWERLEHDHDHVIQYLDKLSAQLSDSFGRPGTCASPLLLHTY
jgi:hypothetical protein